MLLAPGSRPVPNCPDYALVGKLGAGAFGEVWHAHGPGAVDFALKFVRLNEQLLALELRALDAVKSIRHPNLVRVYGVWLSDSWLILAMELCDCTLLDLLAEAQTRKHPGIPLPALLSCMNEAADGLDALNANHVQHRDVKPAKLLLHGSVIKVADFGLAKVLAQTVGSNTGAGTIAYTAPECFRGKLAPQSDQYSLAVTYYHLRTGQLPFKGEQAQVMYAHLEQEPDLSALPPGERTVLARALAKEPGKRWPSCAEFVDAMAIAGEPRARHAAKPGRGGGKGQECKRNVSPNGHRQHRDGPPAEYTFRKALMVCLGFLLFPAACLGVAAIRGLDSPLKYPVWAVTLQQKEEWRKSQPTPWKDATAIERFERLLFGELIIGCPPAVFVWWGYFANRRAERRWLQGPPGRTLADLTKARARLARANADNPTESAVASRHTA